MKRIITIFTTDHPDTLGNACRLEMIKYLSKMFDVTILTNQHNFVQKFFPECKVIGLKVKPKISLSLISDILYYKNIARFVNGLSGDVVFMFHDTSLVALWLNLPVFQYIHQYGQRSNSNQKLLLKNFIKSKLEKLNDNLIKNGLKRSEINFVVSMPIMNIFREKGINNLELIPHGLNLKKYQKPVLTEIHKPLKQLKNKNHFIVTYAGWISETRGFDLMLDTIKNAVKSDNQIVLVLAGADNVFSKKIDSFVKKNNLDSNIINLGIIDSSVIPGILHYSDVCLSFLDDIPAFHISPPQKVIEYFAASKPVICNKIAPHEWLVTHEYNGLIINYDAKELLQAIIKLKKDEIMLKTISMNALKTSYQYDYDIVYGRMTQKIKEALNKPR